MPGARIIAGRKGRGTQLRTGGFNARGPWLLFLHADTQLGDGWENAVRHHVQNAPDRAACFRLAYRSQAKRARLLEQAANLRTRLLGLPYGDQGLLISRVHFDKVGGYHDLPLMEDVAIVRRIGKASIDLLPARANTSAAKYEADGWGRRAGANAILTARYYLGARPNVLAAKYR